MCFRVEVRVLNDLQCVVVRQANGGVDVPETPGLGADPEEDMIAKYKI